MTDQTMILFVDDDEEDHFIMLQYFKEVGKDQHVKFIRNGQEAIDFLERISDDSVLPRLIVLDLNMPKKDEREALKELKQHPIFKKIPVIVFTTTKNEIEIKRCYELGANSYVVKPLTFDELLMVVENIRSYWFQTASIPA